MKKKCVFCTGKKKKKVFSLQTSLGLLQAVDMRRSGDGWVVGGELVWEG